MDYSGFKKKVLSVKELSSYLKQVIESELFMNIKVRGEIVSKQIKGNNTYISLIDPSDDNLPSNKKATLRAIVFSWYSRNITSPYKEGDEVVLSGDLSYYAPFGTISLIAKDVWPVGEGNELLKLKRLEEKLEKEGLFAPERKRKIPAVIHKIAIITSAAGAAYHDIMETLSRKVPVSTILYDAVVQGENAPLSLCKALDKAYKSDADVIIFGRGGGSKTDLSCFNDERVVRKLAESPLPVISGIGHEIDRSLCDLVADYYAITPTAAADAALPNLSDVLNAMQEKKERLERRFSFYLNQKELLVSSYQETLLRNSPSMKIEGRIRNLSSSFSSLQMAYLNILHRREMNLSMKENSLIRNNPLLSLKEGVAIVRKKGIKVKGIADLKEDDQIELGFKDGIALTKVLRKEEN